MKTINYSKPLVNLNGSNFKPCNDRQYAILGLVAVVVLIIYVAALIAYVGTH